MNDAAKTDAAAKAPAPAPASDTRKPEPSKVAWLTVKPSPEFGPKGRFVDLTDAEHKAAPKGVLAAPTPEQLAQRI